MKDAMWLGAIALLAAPGTLVCRMALVAQMSRAAQWALAFAAGILIAFTVMYIEAVNGIHWTRANVAIPLVILAIAGMANARRHGMAPPASRVHRGVSAVSLIALIYAIADARATCGDLIFIWAPKAQAFTMARTINTRFLAFPHYYLMHPDYPPLVPLIESWGSMAAHQFGWWGALFVSVLIVAAIVAALRGFGAPAEATTLAAVVLSFAFVVAYLPGGADPFLLLFESIAVMALTFDDSRGAHWIAAFALAGAALSKVEGASFAVIVAIAYLLTRRKPLRAVTLLAPAAFLLGSWLLFAWNYGLLDQYARAHGRIEWDLTPKVIAGVFHEASYHALWLPWIAAAAPLFVTRSWRAAALPLLVAAGSISATLFFYLHSADPTFWIASSANRILVTPLTCLLIASSRSLAAPRVSSRAP